MPLTIICKKPRLLIGQVECVGFPFETPDGWFSGDTETTGLDPWGEMGRDRNMWPSRPFAFSFCNAVGETAYVRWQVDPYTREVIVDPRTRDLIQEIVGDDALIKNLFNATFDWRMCEFSGIELRGEVEDNLVRQHVLNPDEWEYGLKYLSERYLGVSKSDEKDLKDSTKQARARVQRARLKAERSKADLTDEEASLARYAIHDDLEADYWLADPAKCRHYAVQDAHRTALLRLAQIERLDEDAEEGGMMWETYREEMALLRVIKRMEDRGVRVDPKRNAEVIQFYRDYLEDVSEKVAKEAGDDFNPASFPQKCREFFVKRKHLPVRYKKDKGKKEPNACGACKGMGCAVCQDTGHQPMCDGEFLEKIGVEKKSDADGNELLLPKDALAYWILHHSAAKTMLGFVAAYERYMVEESKDVRVLHPNYKQAGPITDRFSCNHPNLQNVAADDSGKKKSNVPYRPRECFIPRPGRILYLPDYSQIEVWITALRARDKALLSALTAGGDTHGRIASLIWGGEFDLEEALRCAQVDPRELKKDELANLKVYKKKRKRSKFVQFCKIYGGGPETMAKTIGDGCTIQEAAQISQDYDDRFQGVSKFMRKCIDFAREHGYIENAFGRRYPIDRHFAYKAANYDIQSSAAVVIKRAMIRVDRMCATKYAGDLEMLLTIHDELMIEGSVKNHSNTVMKDIVTCMQGDSKFLGCPIPLPVGMKISRERWSSYQEIDLDV